MSNITKLANKLNSVYQKFELDEIDIQLLGVMSEKWEEGRDVRVTDMTLKFAREFASPANIHYRLTTDLVNMKLIKLEVSEEDARVKHIVKGSKFDSLDEYVGSL
jgi:hypothetical protein